MTRKGFSKSRRLGPLLAMALCCLVAVKHASGADKPRPPRRIAIAPLTNLRPDGDTDWIGAGAAETLTTKLAGVPGLVAIERTRIMEVLEEQDFQQADFSDPKTAVRLGRLVGAERIVIGTYVADSDKILFNVRVIDVRTAVVLNAASLQTTRSEIFDALYRLADAVIQSFDKKVVIVGDRPTAATAPAGERVVLLPEERESLRERGTTNPQAFEAFSKGVSATQPDQKIRWYTRAIELDTQYAWAYYNRGCAYDSLGQYDRAIKDYDRAIQLDPQYAAAYENRAVALYYKGDYDAAWADVRKCQSLGGKPHPGFLQLLREASGRDE